MTAASHVAAIGTLAAATIVVYFIVRARKAQIISKCDDVHKLCECRAVPTEAERAAISPEDIAAYADHTLQRQPGLSPLAAADWACRNMVDAPREPDPPPLPPIQESTQPPPLISVLTPTSVARHWSHQQLYECFKRQQGSMPERELLILDDGGIKSPFFTSLRDKRVRYFHAGVLPPSVRTVGAKRNWLAAKAKGEILVAFDDDDVYSDEYLSRMVGALRENSASLVQLASWVSYNVQSDSFAYYDAAADTMLGHHARRWGYGFSFVYTRALAAECPFPSVDHGEDYAFVMAAAAAGHRVLAFADTPATAACVHVTHGGNSSGLLGARAFESGEACALPRERFAAAREHSRKVREAMEEAKASRRQVS